MPTIIATRSLVFTNPKGEHLKIDPGVGTQEIPDWVLDTDTYKMALKGGAVAPTGPAPNAVDALMPSVPTLQSLLNAGYDAIEAEKIFSEETRKYNAGEPPYPPKVLQSKALTHPTFFSLVHAGLPEKMAVAVLQGSSSEITPPTKEEVLAAGYSKEDAERIVADEQAKFEEGTFPYPPKVKPKEKLAGPTLESLMEAGLSHDMAKKVLAEAQHPAEHPHEHPHPEHGEHPHAEPADHGKNKKR